LHCGRQTNPHPTPKPEQQSPRVKMLQSLPPMFDDLYSLQSSAAGKVVVVYDFLPASTPNKTASFVYPAWWGLRQRLALIFRRCPSTAVPTMAAMQLGVRSNSTGAGGKRHRFFAHSQTKKCSSLPSCISFYPPPWRVTLLSR